MTSLDQPGIVETTLRRCDGLAMETPAQWGVMTAHQMVQHLSAAMRGASDGEPLASIPSPMKNPVARFMALRSGIRWPKSVPTLPQLETKGKPKPDPAGFDQDLAGLRADLVRFAALDQTALSPIHPIFGNFTRKDWMLWAYLHADHHLRQFGL
jgi:hypothetical protein